MLGAYPCNGSIVSRDEQSAIRVCSNGYTASVLQPGWYTLARNRHKMDEDEASEVRASRLGLPHYGVLGCSAPEVRQVWSIVLAPVASIWSSWTKGDGRHMVVSELAYWA